MSADEIAELREAMEEAYKDMVKAKKALELIDKDKDELKKEKPEKNKTTKHKQPKSKKKKSKERG